MMNPLLYLEENIRNNKYELGPSQWVKPVLGMPASYIRTLLRDSASVLPVNLPVNACRQASEIAQVLGFQLPKWKSQMECHASDAAATVEAI